MSTLRINDLFESRLVNWAEINNVKYSLANVDFVGDESIHLEPFIAPELSVALGIAQEVETYSGNYQINIVMRKGTGAKAGYQLAEEIISLFPRGLVLSEDTFNCYVNTGGNILPAIAKDDLYTLPVTIGYWAGY
ncbi:uncharacterized protein DUF4128 [Serratia fonticola]|uniref:Uncharacterized protein DUF4128 n=1 Tax=Serratia fonticola TaxID=47917 RepID=A0A559T7S1_SERFO|nr:phage tail terminator-like protein [Serratia fonticola]TQI81826.1 uncharacterized protein DUF4128 [Serratia fonticola]TQI96151.1 uncharacterized protein DUF4128 [Serratia fonticola]TVZ70648.1 uncharacterized protein DUF4128 [Serratia fonticola]